MFDSNKSSGFLTTGKTRTLPRLENLEDRAVPAVMGAMMAADTSAISSYQVNFEFAKTDAARIGALQQFNPALGTLTSVDLIATSSTSTHAIMENMDANSADFKAEVNADIRFNVAGSILSATPSTTKTATLDAFDGTADLKGASSHDFGDITLSGTFETKTLTSPADLSAYIGTGTVSVAEQANATTCSCGTGNLLSMVTTKTSGSVKVVYHYTPSTPTPPPPPITPPPENEIVTPSKIYFLIDDNGVPLF